MTFPERAAASAAVVVDTAPLRVVADMVRAGSFEVVLVLDASQAVLGLLRADAVLRLASRLPEAPVRLLPLQKVVTVRQNITPAEASRLLRDEAVNALLVEKPLLRGWSVMTREGLQAAQLA